MLSVENSVKAELSSHKRRKEKIKKIEVID
jgi:hypothetical protein